mmetsp:Transcript_21112/g.32254  ORF Transcript_21112/g.32254 Transcript_21112/m.32254 type:complete len:604 (-) Transcript_21112:16-1827(-)
MDPREEEALRRWKPTLTSKQLGNISMILKPTSADIRRLTHAYEQVVTAVKKTCGPKSMIKGGSFGKGTNLCSRKEIDLVVIFNDFSEANIGEFLDLLEGSILANLPDVTKVTRSPHAVQFVTNGIEVDLLPAAQIPGDKGFRSGDGIITSAAFSKLQVEFVRKFQERFQNSVRILKFWKKQHKFPSKSTNPPSYMIEVILAFVLSNLPSKPDYNVIFNQTMEVFRKMDKNFKLEFRNEKGFLSPTSKGPIILDPVNKDNNIIERFNPAELIKYASDTLKRKLVKANNIRDNRKLVKLQDKVFIVVGNMGVGKTTLLNRLFNLKMKASDSGEHVTDRVEIHVTNEYTVIDTVGLDYNSDNIPVLSKYQGMNVIVVHLISSNRYIAEINQTLERLSICEFKNHVNFVRSFNSNCKASDVSMSVTDLSVDKIHSLKSFIFPIRTITSKTISSKNKKQEMQEQREKRFASTYPLLSPKLLLQFGSWKHRGKVPYLLILNLAPSDVAKYKNPGNAFLKTLVQFLNVYSENSLEKQVGDLSSCNFLGDFTRYKLDDALVGNLGDKKIADLLEAYIGKCSFDKNMQAHFDVFKCLSDMLVFYNNVWLNSH